MTIQGRINPAICQLLDIDPEEPPLVFAGTFRTLRTRRGQALHLIVRRVVHGPEWPTGRSVKREHHRRRR